MTARVSQDPSDAKFSRKKHCSAMLFPLTARHDGSCVAGLTPWIW